MSQVAIRVEGLGKRYRLGQQVGYKTLRETFFLAYHMPTRVLGQRLLRMRHSPSAMNHELPATSHELSAMSHEPNHIWALKDVSFEVKQGEAIGIIGRNGSGKSTLLKILSRITAPTEGRAEIHGRVGSLLEVGTGFHPELTGRENIYLNGAIIGMRKAEIDRRFDEIVDFAEIEKFLDTPVKRYSSGMYVRLAFAVAAHLEPDILVVDEVLAVGDVQFQKKCLGKMGNVTKEGRTVLFVSHNMRAIASLCDSALLLRSGKMEERGSAPAVIDSYLMGVASAGNALPLTAQDVIISSFQISQKNVETDHIDGSGPFSIRIAFELLRDLDLFRMGIYLRGVLGDVILRSFVADWNPEAESLERGRYEARLDLPGKLLSPGNYVVQLHASRYGLVDYLGKFNIEKSMTVLPPLDFNLAHMGESFESTILMGNRWEIGRVA